MGERSGQAIRPSRLCPQLHHPPSPLRSPIYSRKRRRILLRSISDVRNFYTLKKTGENKAFWNGRKVPGRFSDSTAG